MVARRALALLSAAAAMPVLAQEPKPPAHALATRAAASSDSGSCGCESDSGWMLMEDTFFTGSGKLYVTTMSESAEQCQLACCYRLLGCTYFSCASRRRAHPPHPTPQPPAPRLCLRSRLRGL